MTNFPGVQILLLWRRVTQEHGFTKYLEGAFTSSTLAIRWVDEHPIQGQGVYELENTTLYLDSKSPFLNLEGLLTKLREACSEWEAEVMSKGEDPTTKQLQMPEQLPTPSKKTFCECGHEYLRHGPDGRGPCTRKVSLAEGTVCPCKKYQDVADLFAKDPVKSGRPTDP